MCWPSVVWRCWLGSRKGIRPVIKRSGGVLALLSVWSEMQTCHCHSLSLASVKSRLVLPFWYQLTRVVSDTGPLNGCVLCAGLVLSENAKQQSAACLVVCLPCLILLIIWCICSYINAFYDYLHCQGVTSIHLGFSFQETFFIWQFALTCFDWYLFFCASVVLL